MFFCWFLLFQPLCFFRLKIIKATTTHKQRSLNSLSFLLAHCFFKISHLIFVSFFLSLITSTKFSTKPKAEFSSPNVVSTSRLLLIMGPISGSFLLCPVFKAKFFRIPCHFVALQFSRKTCEHWCAKLSSHSLLLHFSSIWRLLTYDLLQIPLDF